MDSCASGNLLGVMLWSHIPPTAIVSDTSGVPQNDGLGNLLSYLGKKEILSIRWMVGNRVDIYIETIPWTLLESFDGTHNLISQ